MMGLETQKTQGHTDVVVQISSGGEGLKCTRKHGECEILRGCLPIAAGDADDFRLLEQTVAMSKALKG